MRQRRAAAPYAKALFALARERNHTELIGRELGDMAVMFESDPDLRDFLARPWIPAPVKRAVAMEVAQRSGLSQRARIRTAVVLTDEERGMMSAKVGQALGGRQVVLEEVVDRAMLGSFVVESGSVVLDGSLQGHLERMRRRLTSD